MSRGQLETIHQLQIRAGGRLLAAQRGKPDSIVAQAPEQRFHFADAAAAVRRRLVQDAEPRFLLGYRHLRGEIHQVQMHSLRHFIAIGVSLREMIAGLKKQDRNAGLLLDHEIHQRHAFGLKAAGDAGRAAVFREYVTNQRPRVIDLLVQRHGCQSLTY